MTYIQPETPDKVTDVWCVDQILLVREHRQERNLTFPRFVRALNRVGYPISLADYKRAEQYPANAIDHIRDADFLTYAYKALNPTRTEHPAQHPITDRALTLIAAARQTHSFGYEDMSDLLADRDISISPAAYRTAEQGIARSVRYEVVVAAADILGVEL